MPETSDPNPLEKEPPVEIKGQMPELSASPNPVAIVKPQQELAVWDRISRWLTPVMVAASLGLGIKHEVEPPHPVSTPVVSSNSINNVAYTSQDTIFRIQFKIDQLSTITDSEEKKELYLSVVGDLKELLNIPCSPSVRDELFTLILNLQMTASVKVASAQPVTSIERRVQRFLVSFLNMCR